jgi:hypothetical protein
MKEGVYYMFASVADDDDATNSHPYEEDIIRVK